MEELLYEDLKQMIDFYRKRMEESEHKSVELQLLCHRFRMQVENFDGKTKDLRDYITSLENQIAVSKVIDKAKPKKTTDAK
jgi:hypothetical protein